MKTYEIRKIVEAKSIADAIKKEKDTVVDYVVLIDNEEEDFIEDVTIGFHGRRK